MGGKITADITKKDWYKLLISDCTAIVTEAVFTSNWALIEGYHQLGSRIIEEKKNFEKVGLYGAKITTRVSQSIGKSKRTVERAVQFATKYPNLQKLPEGKAINWHKIVNKYLPEKTGERKEEPKGVLLRCPNCSFEWRKEL